MEFRQYLKIFKNNFLLIIIFALLGLLIAFLGAKKLSAGFSQSQLFYVAGPKSANNQSYDFAGYFSQENASNFTDTAVAILESPDFEDGLLSQGQTISVRKIAPQAIRLTATTQDPQESSPLISKIVTSFNQKTLELSGQNQQIRLKIIGPSQPAVFTGLNPIIITLFGFFAGAFFAIL